MPPVDEAESTAPRELRAIRVAIACAVVGAATKLTAGVITGSMSMISSAIDSLGDLVVSLVNVAVIRMSDAPPDDEHNYGHARVEGLGAMFEGAFIFAAGVFMIVLRPFKVGDYVIVGGIEGTVLEVGLFVTAINTPDNVRTFVGNNAVFGGTIKNFSANPFRRVEGAAQLAHGVDTEDAKARLLAALAEIPNIAQAPEIYINTFTLAGPVLTVRSFCHTAHYWDVFFAQNKAIATTFGAAGYPVPEQRLTIKNAA